MLLATIIDKNTGQHNFLYSRLVEGEPKYCGYAIGKAGLSNFDMTVFKEIYEEIKMKPNAKFIMKYKEYDVYMDEKTGYKHYIKEGVEDFLAFAKFNEFNCSLCASSIQNSDNVENVNVEKNIDDINEEIVIETPSKFVYTTKHKLAAAFLIMYLLSVTFLVGLAFTDPSISASVFYWHLEGYNAQGEISYLNKVETYEQVKYFINNSSNLTFDEKNILLNKEYIEDVLPYINENEEMSYLLNARLMDLRLEYFKYRQSTYFADTEVIGYYNYFVPNVIHGKENVDKDSYLFHEWDHLFSSQYAYTYLKEAVAAISEYEYSDSLNRAYGAQVKNVKMLMDVVGPRIIWRHVRTGYKTELHEELKKYLTYEQFLRFRYILEDLNGKNDDELTELIHILYKNKYGKEITQDPQIYDLEGNFIEDKIYFNESKMQDNLILYYDRDYLVGKGIIKKSDVQYMYVTLTKEQFDIFKANNNNIINTLKYNQCYIPLVDYLEPSTLLSEEFIELNYKNGDYDIIDTQKALKQGLFYIGYEIYFTVDEYKKYQPMEFNSVESKVVSNYKALEKEVNIVEDIVSYSLKSIRQRFPDQMVRINKGESRTLTINS